MDSLLERISIDPNICFGKPCIRGTRIWVSLLLDLLATSTSVAEILAEYPQLVEDDIRAALAYGAEMARERQIALPERDAAQHDGRTVARRRATHSVNTPFC